MNVDKLKLLGRKIAIAFAVGAGAAVIVKAGPAIDAIEAQDWPEAGDAGLVLLTGAVAGGLRGLVALTTAFVPTDALSGFNVLGKWRDAPVVATETPPTRVDVS